jgi:poly-gamma-glutamate capsule biosynthesis protein CapA/YwtB (metallophosphatase superfamily)
MPTSDPRRPLEAELELGMSDGFVLAAVGDCMISRPISQLAAADEAFAGVLGLLRRSDVACGNLETPILRRDLEGAFPCSDDGDWTMRAEPSAAADLRAMGIGLVARANNHALDWGLEGMRETTRLLREAGVADAGTGGHRGAARAAGYAETTRGRVGLVSFTTTFRGTTDALPPRGAAPARPGVSGIRLKRRFVLPSATFEAVATLSGLLPDPDRYGEVAPEEEGVVSLLGQRFEAGDVDDPVRRYEMSELDVDELRAAVRLGKQHSDLLVVFVHSHEGARGAGTTEEPGGFLVELAHGLIDAGADAFFTTGIHRLGPVEVYRGRPVSYGLGNFICSDLQEPLGADLHEDNEAVVRRVVGAEPATDADLTNVLNAGWFSDPEWFTSVVVRARFGREGLVGMDIHPITLGYGQRLTRSGVPGLAPSDVGRDVLASLADRSAGFGTRIEVTTDDEGRVRGTVVPVPD